MEYRLLRYFIAVAEELHFGRAAQRLHITQPSLSHQILALEQELGTRLLERTKRSVRLTPAGQLFLDEAYQAVAQLERAVSVAQRAGRGELGHLRIGFDSTVANTRLPSLIRTFRDQAPDVAVDLLELAPPDLLLALQDGRLDVAVFRLPLAHPLSLPRDDFRGRTTSREPYWVALPDDHPLAAREAIALAELRDEPFVFFPRRFHPSLHDALLARCRRAGFEPRVTQEATLVQTLVALVAAGFGVTLVPASVQALRLDGVVYRPLSDPDVGSQLRLVWRRDDPSAVLQAFLELLERVVRARPDAPPPDDA